MNIERGTKEFDFSASREISCAPKDAEEFVQRLLESREKSGEKIMTLVIDGAKVEPQKNFAQKAIEYQDKKDGFSVDYRKYHVSKSVHAGIFVAILEKIIEESKGWSEKLEKTYDTSWEEKVLLMVSRFPWTETDKISSACSSLRYAHENSEKLGLKTPTLIILNFDRLKHPCYGIRYNPQLANDLIKFSYGTNVILFRSGNNKIFNDA